jgi:hypothetical protein
MPKTHPVNLGFWLSGGGKNLANSFAGFMGKDGGGRMGRNCSTGDGRRTKASREEGDLEEESEVWSYGLEGSGLGGVGDDEENDWP